MKGNLLITLSDLEDTNLLTFLRVRHMDKYSASETWLILTHLTTYWVGSWNLPLYGSVLQVITSPESLDEQWGLMCNF